jgi:prefoldin subunit 5
MKRRCKTLKQRVENLEAALVAHDRQIKKHEARLRAYGRQLHRSERPALIGFHAEGTPGYGGDDD